jgi:NAD-dependent SIR2 family protein deacetylase
MRLKGVDVPVHTCPACGESTDRSAYPEAQRGPQPGDVSVCYNCGYVTLFEEGLMRRPLTQAELDALPEDVLMMITRINRARARAGLAGVKLRRDHAAEHAAARASARRN